MIMARPGILNLLYDDLQHWRYSNPAKDAELMSLRFIKPINLNRQMVFLKYPKWAVYGVQGRIRSGYSCGYGEHSVQPWHAIIDGNVTWLGSNRRCSFTDRSSWVTRGDDCTLKTSVTSPEFRYRRGDEYYTVIFPAREAKIRCPVLDNPIEFLLEVSKQY